MKFVCSIMTVCLTIFCVAIRQSSASNEKFYCLSETNLKHCTICCLGYGLDGQMLPTTTTLGNASPELNSQVAQVNTQKLEPPTMACYCQLWPKGQTKF